MKQTLLSLLMMLLPLMANAEAIEINGIYYNLWNGAEVTNGRNEYTGNVVIPSSVVHNNVAYSVTSVGIGAFRWCTSLTSVTIPNSVTSIEAGAFQYCNSLTSITIPNSVTSIGPYAFSNCNSLTSVTIPNSITDIGPYAFSNCNSLTSVTIPNSVTDIEERAFSNCNSLTSVTIPNSVTDIGRYAFAWCSGLTSITIPNSVTSIGECAFGECSGLTSVTIPNSVTDIGDGAFTGCSGLTSVTIPNSVTDIGRSAFSLCSSLNCVTIGSGIKEIEYSAFAGCPELMDVYCYAESLPSTGIQVFLGSYIEYATLHVPASAVNAYKKSRPWSEFKEIVGMGKQKQYYTLTYIVDGTKYKEYSVGEGNVITAEPALTKQGYTFSGWSEIPTTMPAHNVTVKGTFSINSYLLTYIVDGEVYKQVTYTYRSIVTPEPEPTKDGYTFSGWSRKPKFMPDENVTITGTFTPTTGIEAVIGNGKPFDVYSVTGILLKRQVTTMKGLPSGFYIVNNKKVYVR